jgi:lipopolysaccharide export system permease protein
VKRLDRYVFRELLPPFLMGVLIVVVMFQANFYMALGKNDLTRNVPPMAILKIIFLETPGFLSQTLPIAVSLAASLAVSRIARESELTAIRSSGTRVMRVLLPVAVFGILVGGLDYLVVDKIAPRASKQSYELQTNVNILASVGEFITNVQLRLQSYTVNIGSVTKVKGGEEKLMLKDVMLIERPEPGEITAIIAPEGTYRQGLWTFTNSKTFKFRSGSSSCDTFDSKTFRINQKVAVRDLIAAPGPREMGLQELK